jgi:hypothetical protein
MHTQCVHSAIVVLLEYETGLIITLRSNDVFKSRELWITSVKYHQSKSGWVSWHEVAPIYVNQMRKSNPAPLITILLLPLQGIRSYYWSLILIRKSSWTLSQLAEWCSVIRVNTAILRQKIKHTFIRVSAIIAKELILSAFCDQASKHVHV